MNITGHDRTRFSIIGCGYFVKVFDKTHPLYLRLKSIKNVEPLQYITGFQGIEILGLLDEKGDPYSSFYEIKPTLMYPVYCIDPYTRLEIKRGDTKSTKIHFRNITRTDYLFPPSHATTRKTLVNEGLLVLEYDKGHFGSTTHPREFLLADKLTFEILSIPELNATCIRTIHVNENEVILKKPDTLNYGLNAFLV